MAELAQQSSLVRLVDQEKSALKLLEYLGSPEMAALKQTNRATQRAFNRYLANYICMQLAIDKYNKRGRFIIILEEEVPAIRVVSNRA